MGAKDLSEHDKAFLEFARQGHLSTRPELSTYHIALLRFPADYNARLRWVEQLNHALRNGKLPRPNASTTITKGNITITAYHISASAYREYVILQRLFGHPHPSDSLERCWIPDLEFETPVVSQSDATLGAQRREQLRKLASDNQERKMEREAEWELWRAEARRIKAQHSRQLSKSALAPLIKKSLKLPDSISTIRQKI